MHAFDSGFYATTATVIPVLYVALFLQQGSSFSSILDRLNRSPKVIEKQLDIARWLEEAPKWEDMLGLWIDTVVFIVLRSVAYALLLFSVFGEIASIVVLYNQSDNEGIGPLILISVIGLLAITAAGPVWGLITVEGRYYSALGKAFWSMLRLAGRMAKHYWREYTYARRGRAQRRDVASQPEPTPAEDPASTDQSGTPPDGGTSADSQS